MIESRRRAVTFALLGIISGAISTAGIVAFTPPNDFALIVIFVLPGFAFGVIIGPAMAYDGRLSPKRVFVWVIFAMLGHIAAALCVSGMTWRLQTVLPLTEFPAILITAALGGGLGGGLLAGANCLLVPGARWIAPTIVGATLGPLVLLHDAGPVLGRPIFTRSGKEVTPRRSRRHCRRINPSTRQKSDEQKTGDSACSLNHEAEKDHAQTTS